MKHLTPDSETERQETEHEKQTKHFNIRKDPFNFNAFNCNTTCNNKLQTYQINTLDRKWKSVEKLKYNTENNLMCVTIPSVEGYFSGFFKK